MRMAALQSPVHAAEVRNWATSIWKSRFPFVSRPVWSDNTKRGSAVVPVMPETYACLWVPTLRVRGITLLRTLPKEIRRKEDLDYDLSDLCDDCKHPFGEHGWTRNLCLSPVDDLSFLDSGSLLCPGDRLIVGRRGVVGGAWLQLCNTEQYKQQYKRARRR